MTPELDDSPLSESERAFVRVLRGLRWEKKWTQTDLANELQALGLAAMNQSAVSRIENGTRPVRLGEAEVIARLFNEPLDYFTHPEPDEPSVADDEAFAQTASALLARWRAATNELVATQREALVRLVTLEALTADSDRSERLRERAGATTKRLRAVTEPLTTYVVEVLSRNDPATLQRRRRVVRPDLDLIVIEGADDSEHPEAP